jgi:uncharacterized membrane protein
VAALGLGIAAVQLYERDEHTGIAGAVVVLAACTFALGTAFLESRRARIAGAVTAFAGVLFGVYILGVQLVGTDSLCAWCSASDLVLDALAVACLLRLRAQVLAENP